MTGIIVTTPPTVELPPGNSSSNPATLPPVTYRYALLNIPQTWTAKQTFPLGMIALFAADITGLSPSATVDATNADNITGGSQAGTGAMVRATALAAAVAAIYPGNVRVITAAGDVTVAAGDGLIIMNKTVSQITNLNMPLSTAKIGKLKVVDWKNDSDAFPITVVRSGAETFNGALTGWVISAQGASAVFDPVPGLGYAV